MDANIRKRRKNSIVLQGTILAVAALVVKVIGFFYRIPLANLLTDEGSGYYSSAYTIYAFFLMLSTYGFPAAISKITAERLAEKKYKEAHNIFNSALLLGLFLGIVFSSILWFGADKLAILANSPNSALAIKATAPALLIFSVLSIFRGYFQGMNTMVPTAVSQIIEQGFNAIFSIILAAILIDKGLEYGAAGGELGTAIGALAALVFLILIYLITKNRIINKNLLRDKSKTIKRSFISYWKIILMVSVPMVIGTAIINFTSVVDMFMFKNALIFNGFQVLEADKLFGIYTMKHQMLITLPVTIASALAMASIPSISVSVIQGDVKEIRKKIDAAIRATILVVIPAAIGEFVLAGPIINLLFSGEQLDLAAKLLQIGAISIVFFGISTVSLGIMQGLGKLRMQIYTSGIALIVKIIFNLLLLYIFNFHIYGAVIANTLFALASAVLNLIVINHYVPLKLDIKRTLIVPIVSAGVMGVVCFAVYYLSGLVINSNAIKTILSILISVISYGIILLKLKGITEQEIIDFPKGYKILTILKKLKLI